ncbi:MAG: hypothetical protein WDN75_21760 [Bacteroidota bacterium]
MACLKTASATPVYSNSSTIVADDSYPANIAYASYQEETNLTTANSIAVAKFILQDGGGTSDADDASTTLNSISFSITNASLIRRVALYDGLTKLAEAAPGGNTVLLSGLSLSAPDNSTKSFEIRVSFNASVVDNQQFSFTVISATALPGSVFTAANAGGAVSSTAGDNNRIEVTATKIVYTTQPPSLIGVNTNVTPDARIGGT